MLMNMTLLMDKLVQKHRVAPKSNVKNFPGYYFPYVGFANLMILSMTQTVSRVARLGGFFYIDVLSVGILRVEIYEIS